MHIPNTKSIHGWMVMGGISNMVMSIFFSFYFAKFSKLPIKNNIYQKKIF